MSSFETAFAAWALFISQLGVDVEPLKLPPASLVDLERAENAIGFELPGDFTELYLMSNGQLNPYWNKTEFTGTFVPLFGAYELMPLDKVLADYRQQLEWYQEALPEVFEATVRSGDPVASVAWQPGWVPFAELNAAYYAVDLSPVRGGTYGQVIEYGHDTTENRVLAGSISEFLTLAASKLDPAEPYRYEFSAANATEPHGTPFATLYFDMDWRQAPEQPVDWTGYQDPAMDEWNAANHAAVDGFLAWLESEGFSSDDRDAFKQWALGTSMPLNMRMGLLSPPMPGEGALVEKVDNPVMPLVSLEMALRNQTDYLSAALPVSLEEAFTLLHQYKLAMGEWNQQQFDAAERVINRDRPPRSPLPGADDPASGSLTSSSVVPQSDGTVLLCMDTYSDEGETQSKCISFSSDDAR